MNLESNTLEVIVSVVCCLHHKSCNACHESDEDGGDEEEDDDDEDDDEDGSFKLYKVVLYVPEIVFGSRWIKCQFPSDNPTNCDLV